MGRSRGGLTTKIHAMVDAEGRPVKLALTAGQAGDAPAAAQMLPLVAPGATLIADRAYDTNAIRDACAQKNAWANIPPRVIRKDAFAFSAWVYRQRNLIERFFNRIKQFRGLATRYDRSPDNFLAALKLVAVRIWLARI
jgi:transposase